MQQLLEIWEGSIKATHLFLTDGEIESIKGYVPQALKEITHLAIAEDENGVPAAFMGIAGQKLEMLFVSATERGKGLGKKLLQYGMGTYLINDWL